MGIITLLMVLLFISAVVIVIYGFMIKFIINLFKGNYKKKKTRNYKRPDYKSTYNQHQYETEWRWDEDRQLWVHPNSEKNTVGSKAKKPKPQEPVKTSGTSYSFKKSDIIQDEAVSREEPKTEPSREVPEEEPAQTNTYGSDYTNCYQARLLLTKHEYQEFRKLRKYAGERNLYICPKVRLLDIIEPRRGEGYWSLMGKVQSKHVDFVITDQDLHIKAVVELDDSSHDRPDRVERDMFVDQILTSVGYKVIHTRCITEETLIGL